MERGHAGEKKRHQSEPQQTPWPGEMLAVLVLKPDMGG